MDYVIKKLFDNLIEIVCDEVEDEYCEDIKTGYSKLLYNGYLNIEKNYILMIMINIYNVLYETELNEENNMSSSMKKSLLLKDIALEEIINISNYVFEFAKTRLNDNKYIDKLIVEQYISKLESLLERVSEDNKQLAKWYISESIVDLYYASSLSNNMSLRFSR